MLWLALFKVGGVRVDPDMSPTWIGPSPDLTGKERDLSLTITMPVNFNFFNGVVMEL